MRIRVRSLASETVEVLAIAMFCFGTFLIGFSVCWVMLRFIIIPIEAMGIDDPPAVMIEADPVPAPVEFRC